MDNSGASPSKALKPFDRKKFIIELLVFPTASAALVNRSVSEEGDRS